MPLDFKGSTANLVELINFAKKDDKNSIPIF